MCQRPGVFFLQQHTNFETNQNLWIEDLWPMDREDRDMRAKNMKTETINLDVKMNKW